MKKKKRLIPFGWLPGHWGLSGSVRELAKAEYELEGEELDRRKLEINLNELPEKQIKVRQLEIDKKYGKVNDDEFNKQKSTLLDEPYVRVAKIHTDPKNPAFGGIVLDWNDAFVRFLEENGYSPNPDPATTVEHWFNDVCRNIALEAFDGTGDFSERMTVKDKVVDVIYRKDIENDE